MNVIDALEAAIAEEREQRRRLDEAQAITHIGSWVWDGVTDTISCSDEWFRIFRLEPGSVRIDLGTFLRLIHPADRDAMLDAVRTASLTGEPFLRRHRVLEPDGEIRWIEGRCQVERLDGRTVRMAGTSYDVTERVRYEESLRASVEEVRASRARIVDAADAERRRVERDLHDGAQQRLVSLAMALRLVQVRLAPDTDPELAASLRAASAELRQALAELRDLARGIHPAMLSEQGLLPALEALAMRTPLPVHLAACPDGRLPERVEVAAYYLVAEAITNTLRHAHAARVTIEVRRRDTDLRVEVRDDGVGGACEAGGSGLRGLTDRVAAVGGTLAVRSPRGDGTTLVAELPCA
jgi:signal transduction histidine kinase